MDEITRSLQILGLAPGVSEEELKQAYRELAMVWHPDRFPDGSPLQAKAQEKLRAINGAYEYLLTHGTHAPSPAPPAEPPAEETPAEPEPVPRRSSAVWWGLLLLAIMAAGYACWFAWLKPDPPGKSTLANGTPTTNAAPDPVPQPPVARAVATPARRPLYAQNLFHSMRPLTGCLATQTAEGVTISGDGRFVTDIEHTPPFTIETVAKTELTNIRLHYGRGVVILNWEINPGELRYHDPKTGAATGVPGKGRIPANDWVTVRWRIETNGSTVFVDGEERARFSGNFSQLEDLAGIGTGAGSRITVQEFVVAKPSPPRNTPPNLTSNLVLYFPFDGVDQGMIIDRSGSRNHGKLQGGQISADGKIGGALTLNGTGPDPQFVVVPHSSSLVSIQQKRQMTLAAWIKPRSLPSEYPIILGKGGPFPSAKVRAGYELFLDSAGRWDLTFESGHYVLKTPENAPKWIAKHLNEWTHVAVVVNAAAGNRKLYINGRRVGDEVDVSADCTQINVLTTHGLYIGAPDPKNFPNRGRFDGLIDELRIYARALSGEEIQRLPGLPTR